MGVSLVFHPRNPHVPTVHMNVRCFTATKAGADPVWWFGGGMDLTPYYGVAEDCAHFHRTCRNTLAPFGDDLYPRFKQWCDEYFYLKHRGEARGIGGIFFDDFSALGFARSFDMMRAVGDAFLPAYQPIPEARRHTPYGERERDFSLPARPLRRVQHGLRPRHAVRAAVGRTRRIHPDVDAPACQLALRLAAQAGSAEAALYTDFLPARAGLNARPCITRKQALPRRPRARQHHPRPEADAGQANALPPWHPGRHLRPAPHGPCRAGAAVHRPPRLDELVWIPTGQSRQKVRT